MAISKPTTRADLAASAAPAKAEASAPGYVRMTAPNGAVTDVPEGIVQSLVDSGYRKSK